MSDDGPGRLDVAVEAADAGVVVHAAGEVDLNTADRLAGALRAAGERGGRVVVDLVEVPFMDSSGLKVLLVAAQELGARMTLALSPGSPVAHLLDIAEVADRFTVRPTAEEALAHGDGG